MAFITPCCKNAFKRLLKLTCAMALAGLGTFASMAQAGKIETQKAVLSQTEDGTVLSAEFSIDLGQRLEEAVIRGVPLSFNLEFEMTRPRWWWANEAVITRSINYRLSYTALTRQYRLTTGSLHRNFDTFDEAVRVLSRVTAWPVADKGAVKIGDTYAAGLRLSLDRKQLPKPFQIDALANSDWQVEARVHRWNYVPVPPPPMPPPAAASNGDARP